MDLVSLLFLKIVSQVVIYPLFVIFTTQLHIFYTNLLYYICKLTRLNRRQHCHRRTHGNPPPPFSVLLQDANFANTSAVLSAVRIDTTSCPPLVQAIYKLFKFTLNNKKLRCRHSRVFRLQGI